LPFTSTTSQAEAHCPANASTLHPRRVAESLLVIPVTINNAGPFDFLVDTGSKPNIIDPSLAASLELKSQAPVGLVTASTFLQGSVATVTSLEAGGYTLKNPAVVVEDLGALQGADPRIRGVLGENFLAHFDILIDYSHLLLCPGQVEANARRASWRADSPRGSQASGRRTAFPESAGGLSQLL
jgi:aspartyl protease